PPRTPAPSSAPLSRPPGRVRALRTFVREPDAARRGCPEVRMRRLLVRTAFACVRMREQRRPPMPRARTLDPGATFAASPGAPRRPLRTPQVLTQAGLGAAAGFDGSYVGAVERAAVRPSRDLVERCDRALGAGGVLLALWPPADAEGQAPAPPPRGGAPPPR